MVHNTVLVATLSNIANKLRGLIREGPLNIQ